MTPLADRRPVLFALGIGALVIAFTTDERVFGLVTDGQIMTRTAYAMSALGEIGIARGHPVDIARPAGDAVTRYGIGPSLVRVPLTALAGPFENVFGLGSSQTLFVLEQILLILLAAGAAGLLARAVGAGAQERAAPASPPQSRRPCGPTRGPTGPSRFRRRASAARSRARRSRAARRAARPPLRHSPEPSPASRFSPSRSSSFFCPSVLARRPLAPGWRRAARALAFPACAAPLAALWLAFEIVRFGRPFASYSGEPFSHALLDGLWRLTVGPNKGLFLYFPLSLLGVWGFVRLARARRALAFALAGFSVFLLVTTAAWWSWDGASGWGPRLLVPLVPLLAAARPRGAGSAGSRLHGPLRTGCSRECAGRLQPDGPTTWYYMILKQKPLTGRGAPTPRTPVRVEVIRRVSASGSTPRTTRSSRRSRSMPGSS